MKPKKPAKPLRQGLIGLSPAQVQSFAHMLAKEGRGGDTIVAHINPDEARLLEAHGGSGTINPATGLPEFFAGGPGGVGRDGGGAVAGGASGIGGRGASGNGVSGNGGRGNENSATGSRAASQRDSSYGGGYSDRATSNGRGNENSATGLTSGTTESRDTSYGGSWGGLSGGQGTNDLAGGLGTDVFGNTALGRIVDGIIQGGSYGSTFGPQGAVLGGAAGLGIQGATEIGRALGMFGGGSPTNDHDNGRDADAAGGGVHAGTSGGPFGGASSDPGSRGGGSIGGMGGGRGDSGNAPGTVAAAAQQALIDQQNAGPSPTQPGMIGNPTPADVAGVLNSLDPATLAAIKGILPGYAQNTRFGQGQVGQMLWG